MDRTRQLMTKRTKTYRYLEEALLLLLDEKKYEQITVRDLVDKAGISRTAFYAQFTCKQDFVTQVIRDINREATIISTDYQSMDFFSEDNFVGYYTRLYQYIGARHRIYRALLGQNGLPEFREAMRSEAMLAWRNMHFKHQSFLQARANSGRSDEIMLAYIVSAHIGLVEYWLENEMAETPDYMAQQLYKITWRVLQEET